MKERLTWEEIQEKYPAQWLGLTNIEWETSSTVKTAVVKYTGMSQEELTERQIQGEIVGIYTAPYDIYPLNQYNDTEGNSGTDERLTWNEIKEKYPDQWIGLSEVEWKDDANIKTAVVKYVGKSEEELLIRQHKKEIVCIYTTPDNTLWNGGLMF